MGRRIRCATGGTGTGYLGFEVAFDVDTDCILDVNATTSQTRTVGRALGYTVGMGGRWWRSDEGGEGGLGRIEVPCLVAFPLHADLVRRDDPTDAWRHARPRVPGLPSPFDGRLRVGSFDEPRTRALLASSELREALAAVLDTAGVRGVGFERHMLVVDHDVRLVDEPSGAGWAAREALAAPILAAAEVAERRTFNQPGGAAPFDPDTGVRRRPFSLLVLVAGMWVCLAMGASCMWGGIHEVDGWVTLAVGLVVAFVPAWLLDRLDHRTGARGLPPRWRPVQRGLEPPRR